MMNGPIHSLSIFWLIMFAMFSICFGSCTKTGVSHLVCNDIYAERIVVKNLDIGDSYLTDSTSFRIFVAHLNLAHTFIDFECKEDSVRISLFGLNNSGESDLIKSQSFLIKDFKDKKIGDLNW